MDSAISISIPHFNLSDARAYVQSAYTIPAKAEILTYKSASGQFIIVDIHHKGELAAKFICSPPKDWRK